MNMPDTAPNPEELSNPIPQLQLGNPGWHKGMKSPNPTGRPKGIVDKRTRVTKALLDDAHAVARVVIDAALAGDVHAASLVLSRVAPTLKAQTETVNFDFDAKASMSVQVDQVLQAIADGQVSPDIGKQVIDIIGAAAGIKQIDWYRAWF